MNYIPDVVKLLGLEIGEEFRLKEVGIRDYRDKYVFKKDGIYIADTDDKRNYLLDNILFGKLEIIKLPRIILNDKERKYLSLVINPWRNRVDYIIKKNFNGEEHIQIWFLYGECMPFPDFNEGLMYKGMEAEHEYSLEELGL